MNSTSVSTPERRHSAAKKNTVSKPLAAMFHHSQLPAMPLAARKPVTANGVSTANVVATIEVPVSHHGALPPDAKNSPTFCVRAAKYTPIPRLSAKNAAITKMSRPVRCMGGRCRSARCESSVSRKSVRVLRLAFALALFLLASRPAGAAPALIPRPLHVGAAACGNGLELRRPLRFPAGIDAGGYTIVHDRWTALGLPVPVV